MADTRVGHARLAVLAGHVAGGAGSSGRDDTQFGAAPSTSAAPTTRPPSILIVGGAVADITARPAAGRTMPGGSVPGSVRLAPGGVGRNMAAAAARLMMAGGGGGGATQNAPPVALVSAVGDDALGSAVLASLPSAGLGDSIPSVAVVAGGVTPTVSTVLDGGGEVAASVADFDGGGGGGGRGDDDSTGVLGAALGTRAAMAAALARAGAASTATTAIAADGNLPPSALAALAAAAGRVDLFEPVSVAKAGRAIAAGVRVGLATPNGAELAAMARAAGGEGGGAVVVGSSGEATSSSSSSIRAAVATLAPAARVLLTGRWARGLVVTLGARGVVFLTCEGGGRDSPPSSPPPSLPIGPAAPPPPLTLGPLRACHVPAVDGVAVVSAVGAGDALAGGVLAAAAAGAGVAAALGLGAAAAAQVVGSADAAPPLDVGRAVREGQGLAGRAEWPDLALSEQPMHVVASVRGVPSAPGRRAESAAKKHAAPIAPSLDRRAALAAGLAAILAAPPASLALPPGFKKDLTPKRRQAIPESAYKDGPRGLRYADLKVGAGPDAQVGDRVVVHYEAKWKGVTFMTSRQGMGVTGGTPLGFDVGAKGAGGTLEGLDLGVRGMRVGGRRVLQVPADLAYGKKGVGEIPPNATITIDCELLSIKNSPLGYRTKLVEG